MKILIVRHGDPDYSIDSLTEKGWREAELLSRRLVNTEIRDFYCSPLGRAQDTARTTLEKIGRTAKTLEWLREFHGHIVMPGDENGTLAWNLPMDIWTVHPDMRIPEEGWLKDSLMSTGTVSKVYNETKQGVENLLARYGFKRDGLIWHNADNPNETICLFCHFGIGCAILSVLTGMSLPHLWNSMFMPTSSVTTVVTEEREKGTVQFKVKQMGDTSHLYAAGEPVSDSGLFRETFRDEEHNI